MYSEQIWRLLDDLARLSDVPVEEITLLRESMSAYVSVLGRAIGASVHHSEDVLRPTLRLLLLDDALAQIPIDNPVAERLHYLIGMGLEQTGTLQARSASNIQHAFANRSPFQNDLWYRLALAVLHYLAGGYRVHALTALRHIVRLSEIVGSDGVDNEYNQVNEALQELYSGVRSQHLNTASISDSSATTLLQFGTESSSIARLQRLATLVRERRLNLAEELGQSDIVAWLARRAITHNGEAVAFWRQYLDRLRERGITSFTREQLGTGFENWLRPEKNLLVVMPTGSGKSIIGELMTALTLAKGEQVVWLLPTRALVRQARRELHNALPSSDVRVEELPTTEDFIPQFTDDVFGRRYLAVTTPEKLAALLRVDRMAAQNVGLVVFDEAQLLFQGSRSSTAESVLKELYALSMCRFVLMTAFVEGQEALSGFLQRITGRESNIETLFSDSRPTRRMYGVLTATNNREQWNPQVLLYPPGRQSPTGSTVNPFRLTLEHISIARSNRKPPHLARILLKLTNAANIRSVMFVGRRTSTEFQARKLAAQKATRVAPKAALPSLDVARLRLELGRPSILEETAPKGVAPHHAGLTILEQHLVEKWTRENLLRTVVATPTLAQGVNLPFDLSVVTFVTRRNVVQNRDEPLSAAEIQNMLGRAGRAGYVSDGVCLIADIAKEPRDPMAVLDSKRRIFFADPTTNLVDVGVRRLIRFAVAAGVEKEDWLFELSGLEFGEAQSLVTNILAWTDDAGDSLAAITAKLAEFPSTQQMTDSEIRDTARLFSELAATIRRHCLDNPISYRALIRTGMPLEVLRQYISRLEAIPELSLLETEMKLSWMDDVVFSALSSTIDRDWNKRLNGKLIKLDEPGLRKMMDIVRLWRTGAPISEIEAVMQASTQRPAVKSDKIGEFLNHGISMLAQFWGALAICWELVRPNDEVEPDPTISQAQTCVREGVSNLLQLEWLRQLGGLDRVLAHRLEELSIVDRTNPTAMRRYVRSQINLWRSNEGLMPTMLDQTSKEALAGALRELGN